MKKFQMPMPKAKMPTAQTHRSHDKAADKGTAPRMQYRDGVGIDRLGTPSANAGGSSEKRKGY